MKKRFQYLIILALCVLQFSLFAQPNLVPNYSFEDNSAFCIGSYGNLWDLAVPNWNTVVVSGSTPDLFRPCMSNNMQTPSNMAGTQTPSHGTSYAGLLGTHSYYPFPNGREYIQVQLTTSLAPGIPYRVQYKTSLAENSNGATSMGVALGTAPFSFPSYSAYQAINPFPSSVPAGAVYVSPNPIVDKTNWVTISFDYTPSISNIQYLVIGNLDNTNQPLSVSGIGLLGSPGPGAYYYIDEVEVYRLNDNPASVFNQENSKVQWMVSPNPAKEFVHISFPNQIKYEIDVFDCLGQVFHHASGLNKSSEFISTSSWSNGIYFVRLIDEQHLSSTQKMIIQR